MAEARSDTSRLQRIARAYTETAVLWAAIDADLFSHVSAGADSEEALAQAIGLRRLDVERLVSCCLSLDLLRWSGEGRFVNAPDVERFLVKGKRGYSGPWMLFTRRDVQDWFRLTELMRAERGSRLGMLDGLSVEQARAYHRATASIGFGAGRRFARSVDLAGRRRLLDLGGGSGAYSISAVGAYPGLGAVVFDLPPVIEVTREYLDEHGVADRIDVVGGDFTRDPFPCSMTIARVPSTRRCGA